MLGERGMGEPSHSGPRAQLRSTRLLCDKTLILVTVSGQEKKMVAIHKFNEKE